MPTAKLLSALALPLLLLLPLGACATYGYQGPSVSELIANGEYEAAVVVAARLQEAYPDDPRRAEDHRLATLALHLERARRATFRDEDDEALYHVEEAAKVAPGNEVVEDWLLKTRRKLSGKWYLTGQEFARSEELANAMEAFERSLWYDPNNRAAMEGVGRMLLLMNYREGKGQEYYREGVRALRAFWLHQASANFSYAEQKYIPTDERASQRGETVRELLAEERVDKARQFEDEGMYFAAGNEYRLALLLDGENEEAAEGRERMESEMGALERLEHAEWLRLRGRFDEARDALAEGLELTELQGEEFEVASIDVQEHEYQLMYEEALRLEDDFQYPRAIEAYDALLERAGYFRDAITRRAVLQDSIAKAEDLYARAMETSDPDERIGYLLELELVWPEFKDVPQLLEELGAEVD